MPIEFTCRLFTLLTLKKVNLNVFVLGGNVASATESLALTLHDFPVKVGVLAFWIIASMSSLS